MKDIFGIFYKYLFVRTPNKLHNIKHFWGFFLHFKDPVNKIQTLNFYKHFVHKSFAMNFEISGFVELTGLTCYVINTGLY